MDALTLCLDHLRRAGVILRLWISSRRPVRGAPSERWPSTKRHQPPNMRICLCGYGFFAYSWSFLLTVELFYLQLKILAFLLTVGAFLLTLLASLLTLGALLLTVGKCV